MTTRYLRLCTAHGNTPINRGVQHRVLHEQSNMAVRAMLDAHIASKQRHDRGAMPPTPTSRFLHKKREQQRQQREAQLDALLALLIPGDEDGGALVPAAPPAPDWPVSVRSRARSQRRRADCRANHQGRPGAHAPPPPRHRRGRGG